MSLFATEDVCAHVRAALTVFGNDLKHLESEAEAAMAESNTEKMHRVAQLAAAAQREYNVALKRTFFCSQTISDEKEVTAREALGLLWAESSVTNGKIENIHIEGAAVRYVQVSFPGIASTKKWYRLTTATQPVTQDLQPFLRILAAHTHCTAVSIQNNLEVHAPVLSFTEIPSGITSFELGNDSSVETLPPMSDSVTSLHLTNVTRLRSFARISTNIQSFMLIGKNKIETLPAFSSQLRYMEIHGNDSITAIHALPPNVESVTLMQTKIDSLPALLPPSLEHMTISDSPLLQNSQVLQHMLAHKKLHPHCDFELGSAGLDIEEFMSSGGKF